MLQELSYAAQLSSFTVLSEFTSRSYSSTSFEDAMKKAEEPPTPPPRPQKSHSRASSLDLNKLFQQGAPGKDLRFKMAQNYK